MKTVSAAQIVQWTRGKYLRGSMLLNVNGVSTDSRSLRSGELFVPLRGHRFDGHDFISEALQRGATAILVEKGRVNDVVPSLDESSMGEADQVIIVVDDTLLALQAIAGGYRDQFDRPVIAITGSTGKTTTKDMTASILREMGPVLKSPENYNNEIGLPLTLLQTEAWHRHTVVEMGMRGSGQIRALTQVARPTVGVITNVGTVHMELLGSQEAIQRAKQELVETMASGSTVVLNGDDPLVRQMAAVASDKEVFYYGRQEISPDLQGPVEARYVTARDVTTHGVEGVSFLLCYEGDHIRINLPVPGEYQVSNALAAAAAALAVGASLTQVQAGLAEASLSGMRMELIPWLSEGLVINDAYNANPTSMAGALETAHEIAAGRPLVLVLGDMLELGPVSEAAHLDIGRRAAELDPASLITVGVLARGIAEGARQTGMGSAAIVQCANHEEAQQAVLRLARPGDVILVKGSRGVALENVVHALCAEL